VCCVIQQQQQIEIEEKEKREKVIKRSIESLKKKIDN